MDLAGLSQCVHSVICLFSPAQPALPEPAIALALPLVERQLHTFGDQLPLATAILGFMSRLAATAKESQAGGGGGGGGGEEGVGGGEQEEEQEVYTEEQVSHRLSIYPTDLRELVCVCVCVCVRACRLPASYGCCLSTTSCAM